MLSKALTDLFSAKTMTLWLALAFIAFLAFLVVVVVSVIYKVNFEGYLQDLLAFLGVGGSAGTARNVLSDGLAPRVPMAIAAQTDPSIALGSPSPMTLKPAPTNYAAPPVAPTGGQLP